DSFNFPVYLKEKDEHELSEGRQQDLALPILIDFSCIPEALTQIHEVRFLPVVHDHRFNYYPPLHKLNCSYLI
ncbi:MAG TPA: hypothetical protein VFW11_12595, partial [Cyclobacteriaceae bacterium]|nr:hypothetical protein [Cyclobacteriaceae bacterium]